jgi:hypothetical protein
MPDFDDSPPGPHDGHGFGVHHGPHGGGPDADLWLLFPALLVGLAVLGFLAHHHGYDRLLIDRVRGLLDRERAEREKWQAAVERYGRTAQAFGTFECDPVAVLARPALADVTLPATARFVDAFAAASALRTESYPGAVAAAEFARAAEAAERAWAAAVDAADRIRAARFAPGERALLDQTLKLLATAESTPHEAERHAAYRRALARLSELRRRTGWALPRPATHTLEYRARGVLTAAH